MSTTNFVTKLCPYYFLSCFFFFFFFFTKSWWFVLTKMEILFWFSSFIFIFFFFFLMKVYLFHLDVTSLNGFILHVDYYFLSSWFFFFFFFFEKFLLVCFNLLYVVMFLFLGKVIFSHVEITMLLLKRSGHLFGIFVISSRGFSFPTIFFFFF